MRSASWCVVWSMPAAMLAVSSVATADRLPAYPNGRILVETAWVAGHLKDRDIRLVDMRDPAAYAGGHIPGAVRLDEKPLRNPEDRLTYLPAPVDFAAMMSIAGIRASTRVVVYDDTGGKLAARLWYVLNAFGHSNVALVNGGWLKWVGEHRETTTQVPSATVTRFVARATPTLSCPSTEVLQAEVGTLILDARSPREYAGDQLSPGATRAGRIPNAVNVEWKENVTGPYLTFKSADELRRLYTAKGITPDRTIVTHCASGGRAAQSLFTLKLLGYPQVRVYYGSFDDYSARPDAPVDH